jgi:hypothetical protein
MNPPTPAMLQAGIVAIRNALFVKVSSTVCNAAVWSIWDAMEAARLEGEREMRQEAVAARIKANHPWPVKGGAS